MKEIDLCKSIVATVICWEGVLYSIQGVIFELVINRSMAVMFQLAVLCLMGLPSFRSIKFGSSNSFSIILSLLSVFKEPNCGLWLFKLPTII